MITKELLSEVLGYQVRHVKMFEGYGNTVYYSEEIVLWRWKTINIYELEHKCISWASYNGYQFRIYIDKVGKVYEIGKIGYGWDCFKTDNAIKACQWILENKDKK